MILCELRVRAVVVSGPGRGRTYVEQGQAGGSLVKERSDTDVQSSRGGPRLVWDGEAKLGRYARDVCVVRTATGRGVAGRPNVAVVVANSSRMSLSRQVNDPGMDVPYTRIVEYKHKPNQPTEVYDKPGTVIFKEYSVDDGDPYYPVPNPDNQALYLQYKVRDSHTSEAASHRRAVGMSWFDRTPCDVRVVAWRARCGRGLCQRESRARQLSS